MSTSGQVDWEGYAEMEPPPEFDYPEGEDFSGTTPVPHDQEPGQEPQEPEGVFPQVKAQELTSVTGEPLSGTFAPALEGGKVPDRRFPNADKGYRFMEADEFLFSVEDVQPLWGDVETPLWQAGESLMLVGPPGVGKSTLAHHLILALLTGGEVLGHSVAKIDGDILYLAMDRPKQIARAFRRLVNDPEVRRIVHERVIFHAGPMPFSLVKDPTVVARMSHHFGVKAVVIDSIKDIVASPSDELMANSYNSARQKCLAEGIEWIELHHNRKANGDNKEPRGLDDVFGSRFITAGAGSVMSLWGQSGDTVISLSHIRMPGNGLAPMKLELDKDAGTLTPLDVVTALSLVRRAIGATAKEAAYAIYGENYSDSNVRNIRKKLKQLVSNQQAVEDTTGPEVRFRAI